MSVTVLAGTLMASSAGVADGAGTTARFQTPSHAVTDSSGYTYVTDMNSQAIRKISPQGVVSTFAGQKLYSGYADGQGASARFSLPAGIAFDPSGNLIVSEIGNCTIRRISPDGLTTTIAGSPGQQGTSDGQGSAAQFARPISLTVDPAGNIFVADSNSHTIRKVTSTGEVTTFAGSPNSQGSTDGQGSMARFNYPEAIAIGPSGNLYVADSYNFSIRKITPGGDVTTLAGSSNDFNEVDGPLASARFNVPIGIACDASETLFITEDSGVVRKITPDGMVSTLAGVAHRFGYIDGLGSEAAFEVPGSISMQSGGDLLVVDGNSLRKLTQMGVVSAFVGVGGSSGSCDGVGSGARFTNPGGLDVLPNGDLIVADEGNVTLRRVRPDGTVTTEAGTPRVPGIRDGSGAEAVFLLPESLATTPTGDIFVVDTGNDAIRRMNTGTVSTFAGYPMEPGSADGIGLSARFYYPSGVVSDGSGVLFVTDTFNQTIRKITPDGTVSTIAGSVGQVGDQNGTGASIRFNYPSGLALDPSGSLIVSDTGNGLVRRIVPDGTSQTAAKGLMSPGAVTCDAIGNIYVATVAPVSVKKISPTGVVSTFSAAAPSGSPIPAPIPMQIIAIRGLKSQGGFLYVSADNAVLKIGPLS